MPEAVRQAGEEVPSQIIFLIQPQRRIGIVVAVQMGRHGNIFGQCDVDKGRTFGITFPFEFRFGKFLSDLFRFCPSETLPMLVGLIRHSAAAGRVQPKVSVRKLPILFIFVSVDGKGQTPILSFQAV